MNSLTIACFAVVALFATVVVSEDDHSFTVDIKFAGGDWTSQKGIGFVVAKKKDRMFGHKTNPGYGSLQAKGTPEADGWDMKPSGSYQSKRVPLANELKDLQWVGFQWFNKDPKAKTPLKVKLEKITLTPNFLSNDLATQAAQSFCPDNDNIVPQRINMMHKC